MTPEEAGRLGQKVQELHDHYPDGGAVQFGIEQAAQLMCEAIKPQEARGRFAMAYGAQKLFDARD
jgi:hypothetical protein